MVDFPFCPCAAIHPDTAVLHPFLVAELVEGGENGVGAHAVCSVGVGKVTCHENLVGLHILEEFLYNLDVGLGEVAFLDCTGLVEGEAEEVDVLGLDADIFAGDGSLCLADHCLDFADFLAVHVA